MTGLIFDERAFRKTVSDLVSSMHELFINERTVNDEAEEKSKEGARQAVEELATVKRKLEEVEEKSEQAELDLAETCSEIEELKERETSLGEDNRELTDARAIMKKTKGEVDRLRGQYNDRGNEWGEKLHGELGKRRELLGASELKFEAWRSRGMRRGRG